MEVATCQTSGSGAGNDHLTGLKGNDLLYDEPAANDEQWRMAA